MLRLLVFFFSLSSSIFAIDFYTVNLPPFSYVDNSIKGPFKDIAIEVCKRSRLSCDFKTSPWKRIMLEVKSGNFDACFVVGKNPSRENWMYFTIPVVETEYGFFYNSKNLKKKISYNSLSNFNIIVHQKSNTAKKLQNLKRKNQYTFKIIEEIDVDTAIKKFAGNRYPKNSLLYGNKDIYSYLFKKINAKEIIYGFKDRPIKYRFGFSKKSVTQKEFHLFNNELKALKASGFLKKVFDKSK
jgi:polar amino acid transport system substrate-binding protein